MNRVIRVICISVCITLAATAAQAKEQTPAPPTITPGCTYLFGANVCPASVTLGLPATASTDNYYGAIMASVNTAISTPDKHSAIVSFLLKLIGSEHDTATTLNLELVLASNAAGVRSLGKYSLLAFTLKDGSVRDVSGVASGFSSSQVTQNFSLRGGAQVLAIFKLTSADSSKISLGQLLNNIKPLAASLGGGTLLTAATPALVAAADFVDQALQATNTQTAEIDSIINFDQAHANKLTFNFPDQNFVLTLEPAVRPSLMAIGDITNHGSINDPASRIFISDNGPKPLSQYLSDHGVSNKSFSLVPASTSPADSVNLACTQLRDTLVNNIELNDFDTEVVLHDTVQRAYLPPASLAAPCISDRNKTDGKWGQYGLEIIPTTGIPPINFDIAQGYLDSLARALSKNDKAARTDAFGDIQLPNTVRLWAPAELLPPEAKDQLGPTPDGKRLQSTGYYWPGTIHKCSMGAYYKGAENAPNEFNFLLLAEGRPKIYLGTATFDAVPGGYKISALAFREFVQGDDQEKGTPNNTPYHYNKSDFGTSAAVTTFLKDTTVAPICGGK